MTSLSVAELPGLRQHRLDAVDALGVRPPGEQRCRRPPTRSARRRGSGPSTTKSLIWTMRSSPPRFGSAAGLAAAGFGRFGRLGAAWLRCRARRSAWACWPAWRPAPAVGGTTAAVRRLRGSAGLRLGRLRAGAGACWQAARTPTARPPTVVRKARRDVFDTMSFTPPESISHANCRGLGVGRLLLFCAAAGRRQVGRDSERHHLGCLAASPRLAAAGRAPAAGRRRRS